MKKLFTLLFMGLLLGTTASAQNGSFSGDEVVVDNIHYILGNNGEAEVTHSDSYSNLSGDLTIPSSITVGNSQYTVTSIGEEAFRDCVNLTSVSLPATLKTIKDGAFECTNEQGHISSLTMLQGNLESIGERAFSNNRIKHLTLPPGLKTVGDYAFLANVLYDVSIPSSIESIGRAALLGPCTSTILCNLTTPIDISSYPFKSMDSEYINIFVPSESVEAYKDAYIWGNYNIKGDHVVFATRSGIRYLHYIDDNYAEVARDDYSGNITIPDNLIVNRMDGQYIYPVTGIGDNAFAGCYELTSITLPSGLERIGRHAFEFSGLTSIAIGPQVNEIGVAPFYACSNLESIEVDPSNTYYDSRNNSNAIINTTKSEIVQGCPYTDIPNNVVNIGEEAFAGFLNLTEIDIPTGVAAILKDAFSNTGLSEVVIPEGVVYIGHSFRSCPSLTTVTLPSTLTFMISAFADCPALTTVYCNMTAPTPLYADDTFGNYENVTIYVPYGTKQDYLAAQYWKDYNIVELVPEVTLSISSAGVGTFASSYDLDFTNVTGMKAYIASGFNPANGKLVLTQVDEVPAGTGLYIKGTKGTYNIPVKETSMYLHNMLVGVTERTYLEATTGDNTNFTLQNGPSGVGFYTVSPGYLAAGKAYLTLPTRVLSAQASPIMVEFEDEETTGIVSVESLTPNAENGVWYTLDGRKLESKPTQKGVYIVNGKKTVIK